MAALLQLTALTQHSRAAPPPTLARSFAPPPSYTPTTKVTNSKGKVIKEVPQVYPPDAAFSRRPAWCTATKVCVCVQPRGAGGRRLRGGPNQHEAVSGQQASTPASGSAHEQALAVHQSSQPRIPTLPPTPPLPLQWYVESHLVSEQLVPGDLFDAMVATRRARLGI